MNLHERHEKKNRRKGIIFSITLHALILLLLFILGLKAPYPPPEESGIIVDVGHSEMGMIPSQHVTRSHQSETQSVTTQTSVIEEEVITQNTEDAPAIKENKKTQARIEQKKPATATQPNPEPKNEEPKLDPRALYTGPKTQSTSEGISDKQNDEGKPEGQLRGVKDSGQPGGFGIVEGLHKRTIVSRPNRLEGKTHESIEYKVRVEVKVDRNGQVIPGSARFRRLESTTADPDYVNDAIKAVYKIRFTPSPMGTEEDWGVIEVIIPPGK